jgi:hypothetical protein
VSSTSLCREGGGWAESEWDDSSSAHWRSCAPRFSPLFSRLCTPKRKKLLSVSFLYLRGEMAPAFLVPASVSLDRALDARGHAGAAHLDVLLPQGAGASALAGFLALLFVATPGLLGREGDVAAALTASLAPFQQGVQQGGEQPPTTTTNQRVCVEVVARADGLRLTDRVVVDLAALPGTGGPASLGAAVAADAGLSDAVAASYAAALASATAEARAGRGPVLAVEAAAGWVPRVEKDG